MASDKDLKNEFHPSPTGFHPNPTGFHPSPTGFHPSPTGLTDDSGEDTEGQS
jgi:hypothetical protein